MNKQKGVFKINLFKNISRKIQPPKYIQRPKPSRQSSTKPIVIQIQNGECTK